MRRLVLVIAASALVVSACGGGDEGQTAQQPGDGSAPPTGSSSEALGPLQGTALDGKPFSPAALENKSVVLWFWAPWCIICRGEAPSVAKLAGDLKGEVTFVGVPGLGPRGDMQRFVDDTGVGQLTHLPDDDGNIWGAYGIIGQPAWVFITPGGQVTSFSGALGYDKLKDAAESLTLDG